jgi:hypothetical protein
MRPVGTYLYGRRLYEVMIAWEALELADQPPAMRDFALDERRFRGGMVHLRYQTRS